MLWIENVSMADIIKGTHLDAGENSMLIQIVDPNMEFPKAKHKFRHIRKFKFLDIEDPQHQWAVCNEDVRQIAAALREAKEKQMNVIVHCVAGVCRSGAIVDVAEQMGGFARCEKPRSPNLLLKSMLMKELSIQHYSNE